MTKAILAFFVAVTPAVTQVSQEASAFMQNGWLHMADPTKSTMIPSSIDGQSGPVQGRPLSASEVRHTEQVLSDGSHISHSETERFYRDSAGRMRTETATGAIVFDPVAGYTYDLTTRNKTYTKKPVSSAATVTIAAATNRSSIGTSEGAAGKPAPVVEDLPAQMLNGVYVRGVRLTLTIPVGAIGNDHQLKVVNERWFSDDLEVLIKSSNSDPRFGTTTYELTNISKSSPDPALFQIPSGFNEGH